MDFNDRSLPCIRDFGFLVTTLRSARVEACSGKFQFRLVFLLRFKVGFFDINNTDLVRHLLLGYQINNAVKGYFICKEINVYSFTDCCFL